MTDEQTTAAPSETPATPVTEAPAPVQSAVQVAELPPQQEPAATASPDFETEVAAWFEEHIRGIKVDLYQVHRNGSFSPFAFVEAKLGALVERLKKLV